MALKIKSNQVDDVLALFEGKTPDAIAAMVKRRGIKGRMGTTYNCPMAILLHNMSTGAYVIGRRYIVRISGRDIQKAPTPKNVHQFLHKFDLGGYPDIIAPPPRCMPGKPGPKETRKGNRHKSPVKNHLGKLVARFVKP